MIRYGKEPRANGLSDEEQRGQGGAGFARLGRAAPHGSSFPFAVKRALLIVSAFVLALLGCIGGFFGLMFRWAVTFVAR